MWDDSPVWWLFFIIINSQESWQFLWFQSNSSVFNSWTECRSPETERTWCTFFYLPRYHSLVPLNANKDLKSQNITFSLQVQHSFTIFSQCDHSTTLHQLFFFFLIMILLILHASSFSGLWMVLKAGSVCFNVFVCRRWQCPRLLLLWTQALNLKSLKTQSQRTWWGLHDCYVHNFRFDLFFFFFLLKKLGFCLFHRQCCIHLKTFLNNNILLKKNI